MFAKERHDQIIALLHSNGAVTVSDLVARFDVSIETIRRDLLHLEKQGALQRVHGGAVSWGEMTPISRLEQRAEENKEGKIELSETAAKLVSEGDVIYIDSGATSQYFALALRQTLHKLTVITNSQTVFDILQDKDGFDLILCGGHYMREERAFYGYLAQESLKHLHVEKAFVIPSAVSLQGGVCDFSPELISVQKQIMQQCDKLYILADSEKFERYGLFKLCDVDAGCTIITDSGLNPHLRQVYQEQGLHIL